MKSVVLDSSFFFFFLEKIIFFFTCLNSQFNYYGVMIGEGRECDNRWAVRMAGRCERAREWIWGSQREDQTAGGCFEKSRWSTAENGEESGGDADRTASRGVPHCCRRVAVWDPRLGNQSRPSTWECLKILDGDLAFALDFFFPL